MSTPKLTRLFPVLLLAPCILGAQQTGTSPAIPEDEGDIVVLTPFEVRDQKDDSYGATNAVSGTRLNTNLLELPKTVDVVTSEFIKDIGAIDMQQALQYSAGITYADDTPGADDAYGGRFIIRGIQTSTSYRNGFPSSFIVDPVLLDRIEIIKGPSSTFSGPIEPGGTRNYITRKPPAKQSSSLSSRYESYDRFRAQLVNGGPLTRSKSLSYRLAAVYEDFDSHQDFANRKRHVVAGTALWKPSSKITLQSDVQFIRSKVIPSADIGYYTLTGASTRTYVHDVSHSFNSYGPNAYANTDQVSALTDFTYQLNRAWTFRVGLMYTYQDVARLLPSMGSQIVLVNPATGAADPSGVRAVSRTQIDYMPDAVSYAVNPQVYAVGQFQYWGIDHKLMFGADYYYFDTKNDIYRRTFTGVLPRVYLDKNGPSNYDFGAPSDFDIFTLRRTLARYESVSMNNILQFFKRRLTLLQSIRYTYIDNILKNIDPAVNSRQQSTDDNIVQSYGASYKIVPGLSAFVSFSQSFNPQPLYYTYDGKLIDPIEGEGWDFGFKYNIIKDKLSGTVTAYSLKQRNTASTDPDHSGYYIASGEIESKGVEFTLQAQPAKPWQLTFGYSYIDAEVVKAYQNLVQRLGRVANVPKHQVTLWNHYRISNGALKGLAGGLGVVYMSGRRTQFGWWDQPGIEAPSYTKLDLSLTYSFKVGKMPVTLRGEINNLTDKEYFSSYNFYGMPRTFAGSIEVRF
ncbi:TonB-dependent receptor [Termitidicoccus mucosus]|uniref:TonB-dependent receptor n=1 Tax=Termitidicoccus mucosus TaxID=1184151 RepID=A0A178IGM5_9BACT|nr:hypothetical protein AW736_14415 [Opitutaceae bacterium TSB47]